MKVAVLDRIMAPKHVHILTPGLCEHVPLCGFAEVVVKQLKKEVHLHRFERLIGFIRMGHMIIQILKRVTGVLEKKP